MSKTNQKMTKHVSELATVAEMQNSFDELSIDVPVAAGVDLAALTEGDEDPLFVTVEAMNPTTSRNGRVYTLEMMHEMARQINESKPDAYDGHLTDEERAHKTPTAQTLWIGAKVLEIAGVPRLFVKGYVLPYAKERKQYLRAKKATGKAATVSIYGQAEQVWDKVKKVWNILSFNLESIDWSRPGAEGVPVLGRMTLAKEMKGDDMDREEVIKTATLQEMSEHNPDLLEEAKQAGREEKETELKSEVEKLDTEKKALEEVLPEGATPETVSEMVKEHQELVTSHLDTLLEKRIASKAARAVAKQSVLAEMAGQRFTKTLAEQSVDKVLETEEMKSIMAEMASPTPPITAEDNRSQDSGRKYTNVK